jgi:putative ABC transport system permease protein
MSMFQNYLKVALRSLRKHPGSSFINVTGLAIGMACCLAVLFFVREETRYDAYHELGDRIYRVSTRSTTLSTGEGEDGATSSILWGPTLEREQPGIETYARFVEATENNPYEVQRGERRFEETEILFADPSVFDLFSWPLVAGDANTALAEPNQIVLTASTARKYFGDADPLGQTLTVDPKMRGDDGQLTGETLDMEVTGIVADVPHRSHFRFDFLISMPTFARFLGGDLETGAGLDGWFWRGLLAHTYVLLDEEADAAALDAQFPDFLTRHIGDATTSRGYRYDVSLQPLPEIYLDGQRSGQLAPVGDAGQIRLFAIVALFVLLIACINFTNLSTAHAAQRAREVGMRKAVGAQRGQLVGQFLGESVLLSGFALVLGVVLAWVALPVFYAYLGRDLAFAPDALGVMAVSVVGLALVVGLAAGGYPAFFLSKFRPARVLKGTGGAVRGGRLRQGLVVFQFALSTLLIIGTLTAFSQLQHMRTHSLGFDEERLLVLEPEVSLAVGAAYDAFRDELLRHPQIAAVTAASGTPGGALGGDIYNEFGTPAESGQLVYELRVDDDFAGTFGLDLVAGRLLSDAFTTDREGAEDEDGRRVVSAVVNETLVREFGWASPEDALGRQIVRDPNAMDFVATVVGVVRDFHVESLREPIQPFALVGLPSRNNVVVKLRAGALDETIAFVRATAEAFAPEAGFGYAFVDENFRALYEEDVRLGEVFGYVSALAVLIACLGLFGLAALTAEQRTKEIGVRKVLGASVGSIVGLLSRDFAVLVAIACVVAAPVGYVVTQHWLEDFAYRIGFEPGIYLGAAALAFAVAALTVSYHAFRAATADPVRSLRYE